MKTKMNRTPLISRGATILRSILKHGTLLMIAFMILQPIIVLGVTAGKDLYQLVDPQVTWLPRPYHLDNWADAFALLGGINTLAVSVGLAVLLSALQTAAAAVTGYGFSSAYFPGRHLLWVLMILTFFIPQEITFLPRYVLYSHAGLLGTAWTKIAPTLLGQGTRSALMILLFSQFYRMQPTSLKEAAWIDGAGHVQSFVRISLPMVGPAAIVCFVVTFAWEWNDTFFSSSFFKGTIPLMSLQLENAQTLFNAAGGDGYSIAQADSIFHRGIESSAALLTMLPVLCIYLLFERRLIEGLDRTGITGE